MSNCYKTSRRTGKADATPLRLVSAFAAGAGLVLGQRATAEKSNEKTAIPQLLSVLSLKGCIVTIDAMGTRTNIAQSIRDRGADYVLAVKDNQVNLAESIRDFFVLFKEAPEPRPRSSRRWKRITDAWKRVAVMLSTRSTVRVGANAGRGSNPSR